MSDKKQAEGTAIALAALTLAGSLLYGLKRRGVFPASEVAELIDGSMLLLERQGLSSDTLKTTHSLLDQVMRTLDEPHAKPSD